MFLLQVETFRDSVNGKLMLTHNGIWVLFKANNTTYQWDSSSKTHVTCGAAEEIIVWFYNLKIPATCNLGVGNNCAQGRIYVAK